MGFDPMAKGKAASPLPKDVEPAKLFLAMLESARPHERLPWVRMGEDGKPLGYFICQVLTQQEIDRCKGDAEKHTRRILGESNDGDKEAVKAVNQEAWRGIYNSALMVELLGYACRDEDDVRKPLYRDPDDIRKTLSGDEITQLYDGYETLQFRKGPLFRMLTTEEVEWWIEALKEGAEHVPFGQLSHGQCVQLIVSLAARLSTSTTGRSSPGSESADGSSSTTSDEEASS